MNNHITDSPLTPQSPSSHKNLPSHIATYLREWMMSPNHVRNPYPSEQEKQQLLKETGLEMKQLNNWFVNNRKRYWKPRIQQLEEEEEDEAMGLAPMPVLDDTNQESTFTEPVVNTNLVMKANRNVPTPMIQVKEADGSLSPLGDADVLSARESYARNHSGNIFYRHLVEQYAQLLNKSPHQHERLNHKIYSIVTVDKGGRFLKKATDETWFVMDKKSILQKINVAIKNAQYKVNNTNNTTALPSLSIRRSSKAKREKPVPPPPMILPYMKLVYKAKQGSKSIPSLGLLERVANQDSPDAALKELKMNPPQETDMERNQRAQLLHRFHAAWEGGITPRDFCKRLLEFWGGTLVQEQVIVKPKPPTPKKIEPTTAATATTVENQDSTKPPEEQQDAQLTQPAAEQQEQHVPAVVITTEQKGADGE